MKYLSSALLLIVMLSGITVQVNAADITLTGALTLTEVKEGYYTGNVVNVQNDKNCTKQNCSGFTYVKDFYAFTGYCFDTNYLSDKTGKIIQPSNINTFSSGWLQGSQDVTSSSYQVRTSAANCRSCGLRLATSREALNVTYRPSTISYRYFNWNSRWNTVTLKNCTTTGVTFSGAEVIIDGGNSPVWTGGLL